MDHSILYERCPLPPLSPLKKSLIIVSDKTFSLKVKGDISLLMSSGMMTEYVKEEGGRLESPGSWRGSKNYF